MFQPISMNVIRQALDWHGFPVPTLRELSYSDDSDGDITAEYQAVWALDRIIEGEHDIPVSPVGVIVADFIRDLRGCFCEDVAVVDAHMDPLRDELKVLLYVKVSRAVCFWAEHWTNTN